jgi:transcriptional regulator with XRE-family HTH domain
MESTEPQRPLSLGDWILQHRRNRHLTQSRLAKLVGVNAGRVAEWETGLQTPNPRMVEKLAGVLAGVEGSETLVEQSAEDPTPHILMDHRGVAWIGATNTKVIEVVIDYTSGGLTPLEIQHEYPELSLAEIHAALAYYFDHQDALDQEIRARGQRVEELRREAGPSEALERMRRLGLTV